jgi:hypothetical protein
MLAEMFAIAIDPSYRVVRSGARNASPEAITAGLQI